MSTQGGEIRGDANKQAAEPRLSIVIPIFDEADSLETLHREIMTSLGRIEGGMELLLVDDGSRDGSLEGIRKLAALDDRVRALSLGAHCGQSSALEAGFAAARGEILATLDGDLQNDPSDLPRLLAALDAADVVNGVRRQRRDGWLRGLSSRIANAFRNAMTRESVSDVGCSIRVMRSEFTNGLPLYRGMHRFLPTLMRLRGARVIELPVSHRPRRFGRSKYGVRNRLFVGLVDTLAVRWIQSRFVAYRAEEFEKSE